MSKWLFVSSLLTDTSNCCLYCRFNKSYLPIIKSIAPLSEEECKRLKDVGRILASTGRY